MNRKVTVEELEAILNSEEPGTIQILPDGSIDWAPEGSPLYAGERPLVLTVEQAEQTLGGDY